MSISTSVVLYRPLLRVLVALVLVRIILDLWAAPLQCGYWGSMGFFCSAPQDFVMSGVFCARFPPREASNITVGLSSPLSKSSFYLFILGVLAPQKLDRP